MRNKNIKWLLIFAAFVWGLGVGTLMDLWGQIGPTVEQSLIITYIGPKESVEFDTFWAKETMREVPSIYCEGEFELYTVIEEDGNLEIICMHSMTPGKATH